MVSIKKLNWENYQNRAGNDVTQLCWQIKKEIKQIEEDMAIAFKEELLQEIKKIEKEESRTSLRQIQHEIFLSVLTFRFIKNEWNTYYYDENNKSLLGNINFFATHQVKDQLKILLFNYQLFSQASKISNNELARLMATLYQENKKVIEEKIREVEKRLAVEERPWNKDKSEQLYLIKEEIIKNELELKKAREENKLYKNLEIENEGIKKRLRELPKIINGEGEKEPSNQTVPVTPLVPPTPTTLVGDKPEEIKAEESLINWGESYKKLVDDYRKLEENYQSELTARQEAERARDENLVIINSAQKYLGCEEHPVDLKNLPEMDDDDMNLAALIKWWKESDGLIDEETGLDIFDENENGCLIVNQDKVNAYKEAKSLVDDLPSKMGENWKTLLSDLVTKQKLIVAANFGDEIQQQLIAKISSDCKLTTEEESTELAVEELISRIQKVIQGAKQENDWHLRANELIEEGRDLTQQLDQEKSTNANLQDQINQLTQDKNNFQNQLAEAKKAGWKEIGLVISGVAIGFLTWWNYWKNRKKKIKS